MKRKVWRQKRETSPGNPSLLCIEFCIICKGRYSCQLSKRYLNKSIFCHSRNSFHENCVFIKSWFGRNLIECSNILRELLQVPNWVKTSEQEFANLKIDPEQPNKVQILPKSVIHKMMKTSILIKALVRSVINRVVVN